MLDVCHSLQKNNALSPSGTIPDELWNLTYLDTLYVSSSCLISVSNLSHNTYVALPSWLLFRLPPFFVDIFI